MFETKCAQLLVARLTSRDDCGDDTIVGMVSLKFAVSPSPMDLKTLDGLKVLAARLKHTLCP